MKTTIDFIVCAKCDSACEATSSFCSNCGAALAGSNMNNKTRGGDGFYRDEYGWQQGGPPGDPRLVQKLKFFGAHTA